MAKGSLLGQHWKADSKLIILDRFFLVQYNTYNKYLEWKTFRVCIFQPNDALHVSRLNSSHLRLTTAYIMIDGIRLVTSKPIMHSSYKYPARLRLLSSHGRSNILFLVAQIFQIQITLAGSILNRSHDYF